MAIGRPRAFDTDQALDRALEVFWRKGFEGASIADLTAAMGINPPSLYAAFGNKEGLFCKALDRYETKHAAFWAEALGAPTGYEAVERLLKGTAESLGDKRNPPGCLIVQGALCGGDDCDSVKKELDARRDASVALIRDRLKRAKRDGDLPEDADPAGLARFYATVIHGMAVEAAGGASRKELERVADMALRAWPA
ncbi:MAG: TetR/AcrR family transcriptional regulator [Methyloceanibacter sp.]|uniref:TetR/AcrR family transcriptional regulator n=1 Tax=Methyloceanibacter sp. TaxID=1965321 RepID=UPI003D6D0D18